MLIFWKCVYHSKNMQPYSMAILATACTQCKKPDEKKEWWNLLNKHTSVIESRSWHRINRPSFSTADEKNMSASVNKRHYCSSLGPCCMGLCIFNGAMSITLKYFKLSLCLHWICSTPSHASKEFKNCLIKYLLC